MTTATWSQDVRHVVISLKSPKLNSSSSSSTPTTAVDSTVSSSTSHFAGDVAVIYPVNDPNLVARMIARLGKANENLLPESIINIKSLPTCVKRKSRLSELNCCRLDRLFSSFLDIAGVPQRGFFEGVAEFTENNDEKEKLMEISSAEGTDLFYDYCLKEKRNYVEVLEDFKTVNIPLSRLLSFLPVLQPRQYSIANSGLVSDNEVNDLI